MSGITVIIDTFRAPGKPIWRSSRPPKNKPPAQPFVAFPVGTLRGPHRSQDGKQTQFAVQTHQGWVPFTGSDEAEVRARAEELKEKIACQES